eukprot:gene14100-30004_t
MGQRQKLSENFQLVRRAVRHTFTRLPGPFGQGRLVACVSVARVRPRTSK